MAWTVHRLQTELLFVHIEQKHIVGIMVAVTRLLPEFEVEYIR